MPDALAIFDSLDRASPDRYLETVATEHGGRVKMATRLGDALAWLGQWR